MSTLLILRGVPGCGKSTFAHQWLKEGALRARVNRDDIRMQFFGKETGVDESMVTEVEHAQVDMMLSAGYSVIVDDTNIRHQYIKAFINIAAKHGVPVAIKQFDVDLKTAIARNAVRASLGGRDVPEAVIEKMHKSLKSSGQFTRQLIEDNYGSSQQYEPYVRPVGKESIYLFDVDGTLAAMSNRSPFDWPRVGEDDPRAQVILTAQAHAKAGYKIIIMSGRDSACREETIKWLELYDIPFSDLHMRAEADQRKDNIVKAELFDEHIRFNYNVIAVYDDRQQVVDMWRAMGVDCFQVQPGDF
jgi:predicted kinase